MKYLYILMASLLFCTFEGFARRLSEDEALAKARDFCPGKVFKPQSHQVRSSLSDIALDNLYIFNAEKKRGYVIVAGDDRVKPVLGYAEHGEIDETNLPCNLAWLLNYYDRVINSLKGDTRSDVFEEVSVHDPIEVLMETQWGQGSPYNDLCPMHNGSNCLTGCVATAMAQIITYNRWPQDNTAAIDGYVTATHNLFVPELPSIKFDWNNMSNTSIARLMRYAGQSVHMDYDLLGSGAYSGDVPGALIDVFGYSQGTQLVRRSDYTDEAWDELTYSQLAQGLPIIYFGQDANVGGHAFVVDGYANGMYHLNWGWEGYCDGYFTLDRLNPSAEESFVYGQEMVINAYPPVDASDISRPKAIVKEMKCAERFLERESGESAFPGFEVNYVVVSDLSTEASVSIGIALYDDNGLQQILQEETRVFQPGEAFQGTVSINLPAGLTSGDYRIVAVNKIGEDGEWMSDNGALSCYIALLVIDNTLQLQPMPKSEEEMYYIDYGVCTIEGITYHLYSEYLNNRADVLMFNESEPYSGDIYIPDEITYLNMPFKVFRSCDFYGQPELISLSTPVGGNIISDCPQLTTIDLREGIKAHYGIYNCPSLQEMVYPKTVSDITTPENCENLTSLTFNNNQKLKLRQSAQSPLWNNAILPALREVYFNGEVPPSVVNWADEALTDIEPNESVTIHIPNGTLEVYKNSAFKNWNLEELPAASDGSLQHIRWDYCGFDEDASCGIAVGRGDNDVEFAMRIPADHIAPYKGNKITGVEFYTMSPSTNDWHMEDVEYVFVTTPDVDYQAKATVKTIRGCWMTVEFDKPYIISGEDVFVGIGRHGQLATDWANLSVEDDGLWMRVMGTDYAGGETGYWEKNCGMQDWNHPLPIRAIIEGETLPNDILITQIGMAETDSETRSIEAKTPIKSQTKADRENDLNSCWFTLQKDSNGKLYNASKMPTDKLTRNEALSDGHKVSFKLRNRSPHLVKQVTIDWELDGVKQTPVIVQTALLNNFEETATVDVPDNVEGRNHILQFDVVDIDGHPDEVAANSTVQSSFVSKPNVYFPRKIVMEKATGTWCGYCPNGIVTFERMQERYPDNFIGIAVHSDEMYPSDGSYEPFLETVSSFPSARLNRTRWQNVWPFDMDDMISTGVAAVKGEANFTDEGVMVDTKTVFGFSDSNCDYRISFVLVEDKVGPYRQVNYFSDPTADHNPDDYMDWWIHQPSSVTMTYDDVARSIYSYEGLSLLPEKVEEGVTYEASVTVPLPDYFSDGNNLRMVVLLIDPFTGEIMNADKVLIEGEAPAGVEGVLDDSASEFDIFSLSGIKVRSKTNSTEGLPVGIYIINGKKVMVK